MPMNADYRGPGDLPEVIPVFPLPGALLLPRGQTAAEHLRAALSGDGRRRVATATA